jgi:3-phytase
MYISPVSGKFYVIGNTRDGRVQQWELVDEAGKVGIISVRGPWNIGTNESEGCVFDDENQVLFHAEEHDGLFKYGAEPDAPTTSPMLIDKPNERLVPDIEGIALVKTPGGGGYLFVSSQGDHTYAVYRRQPPHEFVTKFSVGDGTAADGCTKTDGIEALAANLGPAFPHGVFICQDNENLVPGTEGNQDFKLVPLERILERLEAGAAAPPPAAG